MNELSVENVDKYLSALQKYEEYCKANNIPEFFMFPIEYLDIEDYNIRISLLEDALSKNVTLKDLDYIKEIKGTNSEKRLFQNIQNEVEKRIK